MLVLCLLGGTTIAKASPREKVTQISAQRTWCYGSCAIDTFTLEEDGSATYVSVRNGLKPKGYYTGRGDDNSFRELTQWLEAQNFFTMRSQLGSGNIDASDFIVSVPRGHRIFTVAFRRGEFEEIHKKFETRLLAVPRAITWNREEVASQNGVQGKVTAEAKLLSTDKIKTTLPVMFVTVVATSLETPSRTYSTITNQEGQFQLFVPPGQYTVSVQGWNDAARTSLFDTSSYRSESTRSVVTKNKFVPVSFKLEKVR